MSAATDEAAILIHIDYAGSKIAASIDQDTTFRDLAEDFAVHIGASVSKVALWPKPKPGYLKYPFSDERVLGFVSDKFSIKGIGTPSQEVQERDKKGQAIVARLNQRNRNRESAPRQKSTPKKDWAQIQDEAQYTFHTIRPLPYLPDPEKSQRFLERLANDPGIKYSMRKHKFSVALLTEMNPIEHTTHESRTLGLNRNRGEVIELRLRTDAYDGYRDYKVIRKTLCHELSHNVWSDHDRNFWDLTKQIEDEVQRNDTLHGGHKLSDSEFYNPDDQYEDLQIDGGGWQGGEFVVGGQGDTQGLSRRDLLARAAEARSRQARELVEKKASSSPDSQAHPD